MAALNTNVFKHSDGRICRAGRVVLAGWILATSLGALMGCGAGMSKADMRKYAIRRPKDPEDEEPKSATPLVTTVAASSPAAADLTAQPAEQQAAATAASPTATPITLVPSSAAATGEPAGAPPSVLSDTQRPPAASLSAAERAAMASAHMERIATALEAYRAEKGAYPARAVAVAGSAEVLSWRVALLPYLGYQDLYQQFNLEQPWNSALNKKLLAQIPSVYQSPERFDTRTNFLAVSGGSTVFSSVRPTSVGLIEDGPEHTALVVEANDELAVPWTKPEEWIFSRATPFAGLGGLRSGHFLVAWGGGQAGAVALTASPLDQRAMFTADAGESFSSFTVSVPLDQDFFDVLEDSGPSTAVQADVAASGDSGAAASGGAASPASYSAPRRGSGPASGLATEYASSAKIAYQMGRIGDALRWYYAANTLKHNRSGWTSQYRWVSGLRRPCATVHYAIGIRGDNLMLNQRRTSGGIENESARRRDATLNAVGEPGTELLEIIEEHAVETAPVAIAAGAAPATGRSNQIQPTPVTYIGAGNRTLLITRAVENACDVLVLLEPVARGAKRNLSVELFDLAGQRRLLRLPALNWIAGDAGLASFRRSDEYRSAKWDLEDLLQDSLQFGDWPSGLDDDAAGQRVAALAQVKMMNRLETLSEMSLYKALGLVGGRELLEGMRGIVDAGDAEELLLGGDREKRRALRGWLPLVDGEELQQLAQQRQRRGLDDDDD